MLYIQGTVRNYKEEVNNINWEKKMAFVRNQNYYIYHTKYNNKHLVKPFCMYKSYEFQWLFGFSYECADYTSERIVDITDAISIYD